MLDKLFTFPIIMVDGDNEEKKGKLGLPGDDNLDIISGEADCPYYDFISVTDRWLPTEESFNRALDGDFDACYVLFANSGGYVVPWSRTRFKKELSKFIETVKTDSPTIENIDISKEALITLLQGDKDETDRKPKD